MISILTILTCIFWPLQIDCKHTVVEAYVKLKTLYAANKKNVHIQYSIKTTFATDESSEEVIAMFVNGDKSKVESNGTVLYQDTQTFVAIDKENKSLLITRPQEGDWRKAQLKIMNSLFDSIFSKLRVISCEAQCQDDDPSRLFKKIQFGIPEGSDEKNLGVITYWLQEDNHEIKKIEMDYNTNSDVKRIVFQLNHVNVNYNGSIFKGNALDQVFQPNGRKKQDYEDFKVVDIR